MRYCHVYKSEILLVIQISYLLHWITYLLYQKYVSAIISDIYFSNSDFSFTKVDILIKHVKQINYLGKEDKLINYHIKFRYLNY